MKRQFTRGLSVLTLAAVGFTATPALAQEQQKPDRDPQARIERRVDRLDERPNLSDTQEQQIRSILQQNAQSMQAQRAQRQGDREAFRSDMRKRFDETDRAIEGVLTPEQRQQYEALRTERKERVKEGRERNREHRVNRGGKKQGNFGRGLGRLQQELNLTEQQQQALQQVFRTEHEQWQAWAKANPQATREEKRAYMESRAAGVNAAVESHLTAEQVQKYRAHRDDMLKRFQNGGKDRKNKDR